MSCWSDTCPTTTVVPTLSPSAAEAATVPSLTPAEFAAFIKQDVQTWAEIVKKSGATVE